MKKYFQNYSYYLIVIALLAVGASLRLYNFPVRMIFGPEQAISLLTSAANLNKFSLLGEYNLQRTTSEGLNLIHGPLFSYFLLPFILIFKFRVLPTSLVFPVLNLLTALALFAVAWKLFGRLVGLFSLFYFVFSALMIYHSLFIWIYNPIPLLGVLTIWLLALLVDHKVRLAPVFWLGIISGIGFSLQYPYLIFAFFVFFLVILISRRRLVAVLLYASGFAISNITRIVFDLRHDFYHLRTLWQFFLDVYVDHSVSGQTFSYSYLHLFPYFCILLAFITVGLYYIRKPLALIPLAIYLFLNFTSPIFSLTTSLGMPKGITLGKLEEAAAIIAKDNPPAKYNVATLWDFDTIARPLRYLLTYYYHREPSGIADYPSVDALYVFAPENRDIKRPEVWELNTFMPYKVIDLKIDAPGYRLYKLVK